MSTTFATYGIRTNSRWNQVKRQFAEWRRRSSSRHELQYLSDEALRDIGVTSCEVHREATKPFWMA